MYVARVCVRARERACVRARDRVGKHGPLGAWRLPGGLSLAWVSCLPKGPRVGPDGEPPPLLEPTSADVSMPQIHRSI